jgi:hypothetical protein
MIDLYDRFGSSIVMKKVVAKDVAAVLKRLAKDEYVDCVEDNEGPISDAAFVKHMREINGDGYDYFMIFDVSKGKVVFR